MDLATAMTTLEAAGTEQNRKTYRRHGARDPMFGVRDRKETQAAKVASGAKEPVGAAV
jgi:hypothetical protein